MYDAHALVMQGGKLIHGSPLGPQQLSNKSAPAICQRYPVSWSEVQPPMRAEDQR